MHAFGLARAGCPESGHGRFRGGGNAPPLPDWRMWYYLAEAAGLEVWLVNARDVKHLPGRGKSDLLTELPGVPAGHRLDRSFP